MRKFAEEVQNELNRLPEDRADALLAAIHKNIPELHKELKKLPPASKKEAHTFSVSKVLQQKHAEGLVPRIAGLEHQADLAGLATMTAGVGDRLRSELVHKGDPNKGSVLGGEKGQIGTDVAGLAMMTAPTLAALASGQHDKWHHWANLGGLAALAAPAADELQARMRSAPGEDPHHRMMLSHDTHQKLHLLGYGALAAPVISNAAAGHGSPLSHGLTLAGYGTLAAPDLDEQIAKVRGKDPVLQSTLDKPGVRPAVDLAGLGLLGAGALTTKHATDTPADLKKKVDQRRFNAGDMRHYRLGQDTSAAVPGLKIAEDVTDEKAQKALERIQMLEANRPSLKQLARWGAVSAGAGLVAGGVADVVRGKKPFGWAGPSRDAITQELITLTPKQQAWNVFRNVTADMGKGMVTSAAVPLINSQLDRNEQVEVLRDYVAQRQQRSTPPVVQTAPAAPVDPKVPPVVAQAAPSPLAKAASYLSKFAGVATTPAGRLAHTRAVGVTPNASAKGPSISEQSKPVGFGRPLAGTTKSTTGV